MTTPSSELPWDSLQQDTEQHNVLHIRDTLEQNKGMDNQYVHHLLSADNVELFTRIYTSDTLTQWCETHVREALALPNVRNAWVADIDSFVTHITRAYNHVPDSVKAHILNDAHEQAASYFPDDVAEHLACNIGLQGDDRWSTIPTEWVGAPGSELRHAAEALGWSPDVLVLQLDEARHQQTAISPHIEYPYSVLALGHKWFAGKCPGTFRSEKIQPRDVAFALAVVGAFHGEERANEAKEFVKIAQRVPRYERTAMVNLVRSHEALDALPALLNQLANNVFPLNTMEQTIDPSHLDAVLNSPSS